MMQTMRLTRETHPQMLQIRTTSQTTQITPVTQTTNQAIVLEAAMLQAKTAAGLQATATTLLIAVSLSHSLL